MIHEQNRLRWKIKILKDKKKIKVKKAMRRTAVFLAKNIKPLTVNVNVALLLFGLR